MINSFYTIINVHNEHLTKDVGLIPYSIYKYRGYESYLVTYDNGNYVNLKNVKGLKLVFIRKITGIFDIDCLFYIIKNAKKIDYLMCFHLRYISVAKIFVYLLFNHKGKAYLKLDGGYPRERVKKLQRFIYKRMLEKCSLVSAESEEFADKLGKSWRHRICCVPNPVHPDEQKEFNSFEKRENVILTVGRLGTKQKATETLLEAFRLSYPKIEGWKLILVGPIEKQENDFEQYIRNWYEKYPEMRKAVHFTGKITARSLMSNYYRNAKIFCLPSRHEGFSLALIEAGSNGDFIIGSDIPCTRIFTNDFKYGKSFKVDDVNALSDCFISCCNDESINDIAFKLYKNVKEYHSMERIAGIIDTELK